MDLIGSFGSKAEAGIPAACAAANSWAADEVEEAAAARLRLLFLGGLPTAPLWIISGGYPAAAAAAAAAEVWCGGWCGWWWCPGGGDPGL